MKPTYSADFLCFFLREYDFLDVWTIGRVACHISCIVISILCSLGSLLGSLSMLFALVRVRLGNRG